MDIQRTSTTHIIALKASRGVFKGNTSEDKNSLKEKKELETCANNKKDLEPFLGNCNIKYRKRSL